MVRRLVSASQRTIRVRLRARKLYLHIKNFTAEISTFWRVQVVRGKIALQSRTAGCTRVAISDHLQSEIVVHAHVMLGAQDVHKKG
jgi:hypothetical protein